VAKRETTTQPTPDDLSPNDERIRYAEVLVEIGDLTLAEMEVAQVLDESPEHPEALSLFGKLKHMRGQLSLAVACSAQIQSKHVGSSERARMHLESMLHLAQDPTQGAGEFLAMGQFQLVQKPTAYLALEEAFRQYVSRRPNEAGIICRNVATRYRDRDGEVYKLAVLAEAWIYELIGDFEISIQILERLGLERGYETDIDRLLALISLYERTGSRERLESAVNIGKYLEKNHQDPHVLGRLALLYRRLGDREAAAEYERRHLDAYRRKMHRADFREVVEVASHRFLPIERLRAIHFSDPVLTPSGPERETALGAAIRGDLATAKRTFSRGEDLLGLKYWANLEALSGTHTGRERAIELYARALREDPTDLYVIGWLLDREAEARSPKVADLLKMKSIVPTVLEALEAAVHVSPNDYRIWRRLATLLALQHGGDTAQQRRFEERAESLERSSRERSRAIGRVLSAATYRFAGTIHGLVHEVWATRELASPGQGGSLRRDDILGNVTEEMRTNVRNTFLATREYAQAKFPHATGDILDYNYGYKVTKEDEPSGGTSAGLPTALAFLSVFLQRPVPQDVASTGVMVTDAHDVLTVRLVGDLDYKVDGAYHRNLRMILVPSGNRPMLERSTIVPHAISDEIVRYVPDLDQAAGLVFGDLEFL
jgi:tetratricopeptide (TPR) repeat protein